MRGRGLDRRYRLGPPNLIEIALFTLTLEPKSSQKNQIKLAWRDNAMERIGDNNLFRFSDTLNARRDIDNIAKDIVCLDDSGPVVQSDPHQYFLSFPPAVPVLQPPLDCYCGMNGLTAVLEYRHYGIADRLDNTALVGFDLASERIIAFMNHRQTGNIAKGFEVFGRTLDIREHYRDGPPKSFQLFQMPRVFAREFKNFRN